MIGAIIGGVASLAGGILGGVASSNARKRASRALDKMERGAEADYVNDTSTPYTQTSRAQDVLRKGNEIMGDMVAKADATKAVMGGTDESVQEAKKNAVNTMGDVLAKVASDGEDRAERAKERYRSRMDAIEQARYNNEMNTAQQTAQAGGQVMQAGMNLATTDIKSQMDGGDMFGLTKNRKK